VLFNTFPVEMVASRRRNPLLYPAYVAGVGMLPRVSGKRSKRGADAIRHVYCHRS
jgi:hypothetical protein